MAKLWGGRFSKDSDKLMEDFHSSISFDQKLYYWDIQGSIAHATMLGNVGVITKEEAARWSVAYCPTMMLSASPTMTTPNCPSTMGTPIRIVSR